MLVVPEHLTCHGYLIKEYQFYIQRLRAKGIETSLSYEEWLKT